MTVTLETIRGCFEGVIPAQVATCAPEGTPNVTYVSQVHYVDAAHVALTYQFFNKTRENILVNPRACVLVNVPETAARYRIRARYLRTETAGPVFESMKAKLAAIASHTGMTGVFRLLGSDIYRVEGIEHLPGAELPPPPPRYRLSSLRACSERLAACTELGALLDETLAALEQLLGVEHLMVLMFDPVARALYTVASRGYEASGVGAEIPLGYGVIGVAAAQRTPIRIGHMTEDYSYGRAVREAVRAGDLAALLHQEIPLPGLPASRSQLAVPIASGAELLGVLYAESAEERRFDYQDEDALMTLVPHLASLMARLRESAESASEAPRAGHRAAALKGAPLVIRRYPGNDSVFLGDDYLIKGVAGAIFWKLASDYARNGRTEFSNRELRVDPSIRLPEVSENLEARLILLERRLRERSADVTIEKTGRGRFRLVVRRPLELREVAEPGA
ncbi:MAG TPA: GAF domain-containing protein [Pelomicrobium sp.]|nr:GAF domain-containing protein [Pelomicrobium sp.]